MTTNKDEEFVIHGVPSISTLIGLREQAGLSQRDVGARMSPPRTQERVSAIERAPDEQVKLGTIRRYVEALGGRLIVTEEEITATLTQIMAALQDVAEAVTADDLDGYLAAVEDARQIGCTDEQIRDAYDYRTSRMRQRPSFDQEGNPS